MTNIGTGLRIIGTVQNVSEREYDSTDKKTGEVTKKNSYTIWIGIVWGKLNIGSSKPASELGIENGKTYSFPIGARWYNFEDKETGENKVSVSFYLRNQNDSIHAID